MSFRAFLQETEKGLPLPVYLFTASDMFLQAEATDTIKRLVPEAERDFNFHVFDLEASGDEYAAFEKILEVVNTVSFFGGKRYTILQGNLLKLTKKELASLHVYSANPAPNSVFILLHNGVFTSEAKGKFLTLKPVSLDLRESEIPQWIQQRAQRKGLEISDEIAEYLIGIIGTDLGLLSSEIEKISLLGKKRVDIDDISDIVTGMRLYSIFDLVNALRQKDAEKAFSIYKTLRDSSEDYSLIGALNWQYSRELHVKKSKSANEYLLKVFELLSQIDRDIKSSGRSFPMEFLLLKLLRLQEGR